MEWKPLPSIPLALVFLLVHVCAPTTETTKIPSIVITVRVKSINKEKMSISLSKYVREIHSFLVSAPNNFLNCQSDGKNTNLI